MADPTSTESAPQSLTIADAAARMDAIDKGAEDTGADTENAHLGEQDDGVVAEQAADTGEAAETETEETEGEEQEEAGTDDWYPEFWSAEDKAALATVPVQLRPLIQKYAKQSTEYANTKAEEAAQARKEAAEQVKAATTHVEQAAKWWQDNGATFFKNFGDKWAAVDFSKLAQENPAEWARLKQEKDNEEALLRKAHEQGQKDIEAATQRGQVELAEKKREAHETIAKLMPEHFGTVEKAKKTYGNVGEYLKSKGFSAERINIVHEAPLFEIFTKAYLYDQAKKQASTVTKTGTANNGTSSTPKRVQPGPAQQRPGNQGGERARQAREVLRKGGSLSVHEAARLANDLRL